MTPVMLKQMAAMSEMVLLLRVIGKMINLMIVLTEMVPYILMTSVMLKQIAAMSEMVLLLRVIGKMINLMIVMTEMVP